MAFCAAALWFLSLFIWDIRVDGGVSYTQDLIVGYLREQGIVHGMRKSQVDCGEIQALIRNDYPRVTWASASIQGTRLLIEIKEDTVAGEMPEAGEEDAEWVTLRVGIDPATARGVVKFSKSNYIYYNPDTKSWF